MNLFTKLIKLRKDKQIVLYPSVKAVYLQITIGSKKYFFKSLDGFDFTPTSLNLIPKKVFQIVSPDYSSFSPLLAPGSEYIPPSSISIQGTIKNKQDNLLFYHYLSYGQFNVGVAGLSQDNHIIWRHNQPVFLSPLFWKDYNVSFLTVF